MAEIVHGGYEQLQVTEATEVVDNDQTTQVASEKTFRLKDAAIAIFWGHENQTCQTVLIRLLALGYAPAFAGNVLFSEILGSQYRHSIELAGLELTVSRDQLLTLTVAFVAFFSMYALILPLAKWGAEENE